MINLRVSSYLCEPCGACSCILGVPLGWCENWPIGHCRDSLCRSGSSVLKFLDCIFERICIKCFVKHKGICGSGRQKPIKKPVQYRIVIRNRGAYCIVFTYSRTFLSGNCWCIEYARYAKDQRGHCFFMIFEFPDRHNSRRFCL